MRERREGNTDMKGIKEWKKKIMFAIIFDNERKF
jgi:hypothetical protein